MVIISYVEDAGKDTPSLYPKAFSSGEKSIVKAGIIPSTIVLFRKFTDYFFIYECFLCGWK